MRWQGFLIALLMICVSAFALADEGVLRIGNVREIGEQAFYGDTSMKQVFLAEGVESIGKEAFGDSGLCFISLSESISHIEPDAFRGCPEELVAEVPFGSYAESFCRKNNIKFNAVMKRKSGARNIEKMSQSEISALLASTNWSPSGGVFDVSPSVSVPYEAGMLKENVLQACLKRLNALRRITGLPDAELNVEWSQQAQYGAVVLAALNQLTHFPSRPSGMSEEFYQQAFLATSSSNLYMNRTFAKAVDGFMNDSDSKNIDRVGHRRWQIYPHMKYVGFGYARKGDSEFFVERVFPNDEDYGDDYWESYDEYHQDCDYDYVSWPASGNFPKSLFASDVAWSISVNQNDLFDYYDEDDIGVVLTRQSDGKTWKFGTAKSDGYFNVDLDGYGVSNCIIFRPNSVGTYKGTYSVMVTGLTIHGNPVKLQYDVTFF